MRYAEIGKGLNFSRFKKMIAYLYNIENHVFNEQLFYYFDKNQDGIVEFFELVTSLSIIEKGDFSEKVELCFSIYDLFQRNLLDMYTLRELIKKCYIKLIVKMESCLKIIETIELKNNNGFTWEELVQSKLLYNFKLTLPTVFDRMDYNRFLV